MKFEYKVVLLSGEDTIRSTQISTGKIEKELNKLGKDGWEMVASKASESGWGVKRGILCIFKREVSKKFTSEPKEKEVTKSKPYISGAPQFQDTFESKPLQGVTIPTGEVQSGQCTGNNCASKKRLKSHLKLYREWL